MRSSPALFIPARLAAAFALVALLFALAFISTTPAVGPKVGRPPRPNAIEVKAARDALDQIRAGSTRPGGVATVVLDNRQLRGLSALAGDATPLGRVDAQVRDRVLHGAASVALPLGLWFNIRFEVTGSHRRFPEMRLRVGRLPLPAWISDPLVEAGRRMLVWRGVDVPPFDAIVRGMAVGPSRVAAQIKLPGSGGMTRNLAKLHAGAIDDRVVARTYCALQLEQRRAHAGDLPSHIRRTFVTAPGGGADNRARLVALAMFVVPERARDLVPFSDTLLARCGPPDSTILLAGRNDLTKHWSLSAALAAMLGEDTAASIGEWKELSDSEGGSGFSFVDLSADRSGTHFARRASDPSTASATRDHLARADQNRILPLALLRQEEGMTDAQFVARYRAIDAARYRATVAIIDRVLERASVR